MEGRDGHRVEVVRLRDIVADDLETFFRHQSDPLSVEMARVAARDEAAHLARWTRLLADPTVGARTIVADGVVAGHVMSFNRDGERELGYWLGREFWGRGITRAAVQQYLPLEPQRPLFAIVAEHNSASRRILTRFGFREISKMGEVVRYRLSTVPKRAS
jgi:RimJ/RimL family protein N-acetyltransferase